MKYAWSIVGFLLAGMVFSKESGQMKDMGRILTKNDFEKIAQFILDNENRQTYCQMYNNNPHYSLEDFHIYLDPVLQTINWLENSLSDSAKDYDTIVIKDWNSTYKYYDILLKDEKVYISNPRGFEQKYYKNELLEKYIPKLKSLIGSAPL